MDKKDFKDDGPIAYLSAMAYSALAIPADFPKVELTEQEKAQAEQWTIEQLTRVKQGVEGLLSHILRTIVTREPLCNNPYFLQHIQEQRQQIENQEREKRLNMEWQGFVKAGKIEFTVEGYLCTFGLVKQGEHKLSVVLKPTERIGVALGFNGTFNVGGDLTAYKTDVQKAITERGEPKFFTVPLSQFLDNSGVKAVEMRKSGVDGISFGNIEAAGGLYELCLFAEIRK